MNNKLRINNDSGYYRLDITAPKPHHKSFDTIRTNRKYHSLPRFLPRSRNRDSAASDSFRELIRRDELSRNRSNVDISESSSSAYDSLRSYKQKTSPRKKDSVRSSTPTENPEEIALEAKVTGTLIQSITKLKKLVEETRIIDEVDDEKWLLNFIEELECHLADLCRHNFRKRGKSGIEQKEILLQVCLDLICYLEKRSTYSKDRPNLPSKSSDTSTPLRSQEYGEQSWESRIKRLMSTLDQCLHNLYDHISTKQQQQQDNLKDFVKLSNEMLNDETTTTTNVDDISTTSSSLRHQPGAVNYSIEGINKILTISICDKNPTTTTADADDEVSRKSDPGNDVISGKSTNDDTCGDSCIDSILTWDESNCSDVIAAGDGAAATKTATSTSDCSVQCEILSPKMLEDCEARIEQLKKSLSRYRRKLKETLDDRNDKTRQIAALQNRLKRFQRALHLKKMEKNSLEDELEIAKKAASDEKNANQKHISNLEKKLDAIKAKQDQELEKIEQLLEMISDFRDKNEKLQDEQIKLVEDKAQAEKELHQVTVSLLQEQQLSGKLKKTVESSCSANVQTDEVHRKEAGCQASADQTHDEKGSKYTEKGKAGTSSRKNSKKSSKKNMKALLLPSKSDCGTSNEIKRSVSDVSRSSDSSSSSSSKKDFSCQVEDDSYTKMKAYDFYAKEAKLKALKLIERGRNFQRETMRRSRSKDKKSK